jgi:fructosamine-3-kinase
VSPGTVSQLAQLSGLAVRDARKVGSQHGYQHFMITLAGGQRAFAKVAAATGSASDEIAAAFAAEASGLRWLAEAGAVPVPEVLAVGPSSSR